MQLSTVLGLLAVLAAAAGIWALIRLAKRARRDAAAELARPDQRTQGSGGTGPWKPPK